MPKVKVTTIKCWWCGRDRKTTQCRLYRARKWINLCDECLKGFSTKIKETR